MPCCYAGGFDAYGNPSNPTIGTPFQYQGAWGGYTDSETGLVLQGHRYYDPATGTWLTRDPIGQNGGINVYGYVGGDPVNWGDPSGLAPSAGHVAHCKQILANIVKTMADIDFEFAKFDPEHDANGNVGRLNYPNEVEYKPNGHRTKIEEKRNRLRNLLAEYARFCQGQPPEPVACPEYLTRPIPQYSPKISRDTSILVGAGAAIAGAVVALAQSIKSDPNLLRLILAPAGG
jgi:RHS repeat-associated protein